jgi:hypothetical protein
VWQAADGLFARVHNDGFVFATALTAIAQTPMLALPAGRRCRARRPARQSPHAATAFGRLATAQRNEEFAMTHWKHRLMPLAVATIAAVAVLAACQDRKPTGAQTPSASGGEYPTPSDASSPPSGDPIAVPGKGADVTAKDTQSGMVGGASGTVASGGKPGSGSTSGAGTGAAVSSDSKVDTKK